MENSAWKRPLSKNTHHTEITATAGGDEIDNGDSVTTKVRRMREGEGERGEQKQLVSHRGGIMFRLFLALFVQRSESQFIRGATRRQLPGRGRANFAL